MAKKLNISKLKESNSQQPNYQHIFMKAALYSLSLVK